MGDFFSLDNLQTYGYWIVFVGSVFEGELILLSASAAAALGYLNIYKVFSVAFLTTIAVDQILFFLGYKLGSDWLIVKFPKLSNARNKAILFLHKIDTFFILVFRFIYGIRTISPLIIGSAHIKPIKFIFLNIVSGFIWAFLGCWVGYTISDLIMDGTLPLTKTLLCITAGLALITVLFWKIIKKKM